MLRGTIALLLTVAWSAVGCVDGAAVGAVVGVPVGEALGRAG